MDLYGSKMSVQYTGLSVLIADDHALVRGGLALVIKMLMQDVEVSETNDFGQTRNWLKDNQTVDLLLLDLLMPGMNGVEGVKEICSNWPEVPVVVVSVREDIASIRQAIEAGALGYIPKTSSPEITMRAIQLVLSGGVYIPPHVLSGEAEPRDDASDSESEEKFQAPSSALNDLLTRRQRQVFDLMAQGKSNKAIAEALGLTSGTIKMHVSRIFKVLGVENRTEAVTRYS